MDKTLYFDEDRDYKKLLQEYFDNGYSTSWLKGYAACLYASMIIDDEKKGELSCFIGELREKKLEEEKDND